MKTSIVKSLGAVIAVVGLAAILSGCSQGYSSGGSTPASSGSSAPSTQATSVVSGPTSASTIAYKPVAFKPTVSGSTLSMPTAAVDKAGNGNFFLNNMSFMVYQLDGKYQVRADLCVPCGSRTFTLQKGTLICGSCGTVFNATTGVGKSGVPACMTYAKKAAAFTVEGDNLVMTVDSLTTAYQNTLNRKN